jgi:hypothetical protein
MHPLQNETPDGALKVAGQFFEFIKVEAGHNYYWAKPYGNVGSETFTRPDIDFTPLRELK